MWEKTCRPFNKNFERKIQTYRRLDRRLILRHITQVELCGTDTIYFYAGVYQKAIGEIQACNAANTTLPVLTIAKKIRRRRTIHPPQQQYLKTRQ
jgi:hypothetical protein